MRCVQALSSLALRLCTYQSVGRGGAPAVAFSQFPELDQQVARALRQANARAWVAIEVLLAGEPLWERAQLGWERGLEMEFFRPLRLLLDDVPLTALDEQGPDARRKVQQSVQAALGSGLLTSGPLELAELLPDLDAEMPSEDFLGQARTLGELTQHLERSGYTELKPLLTLRCATGELFLVSLIAALFRHAVASDPDLFGGLGELFADTKPDGAVRDLGPLAVMLDKHRSRLDAQLASMRNPGMPAQPAQAIDTATGTDRMERGLACLQRGDYDKAIGEFTAALQSDPSNVQAVLYRADAHRLKGDYVQALADYGSALRQDPSNAQAMLQRGQVNWMTGQIEEAIDDFTMALQIDPKNPVAYHYRGKALIAAGDHDGAIVNLSEALRLDPYYAWAHHDSGEAHAAKGNYGRAIADYSEAIRLNPLSTVTHLRRGDAYAARGEFDRASADYGNALRLDPHNSAAYRCRGVAYREQGKYDQAAAEFSRALELDFTNGQLYFERGLLFQLQGNHERALVDFNAAITRVAADAEIYYSRGTSHQALGKNKAALADFCQALKLDPEHARAYHSRGLLYSSRGEVDLALPDYNEALRLNPGLTQAYINRARAHLASGDVAAAVADCDSAIELNPELNQAYLVRGNIRAQQGEFFAAVEDFSRVLRAEPGNAQCFYLRGVANAKLDNARQAAADLTEAIRLDPNHARAYAQRATLRQASGLSDLALSDLAHAVRVDAQFAATYCRQLAQVHSAMGLHECVVADYSVALILDPNNAAAQTGREQAWQAYLTQPRKRPTQRKAQDQRNKLPTLRVDGGSGEGPAVLEAKPSAARAERHAAQAKEAIPSDETSVIRAAETGVHRVAPDTSTEIPAMAADADVPAPPTEVTEAEQPAVDEASFEITILDDDTAAVSDGAGATQVTSVTSADSAYSIEALQNQQTEVEPETPEPAPAEAALKAEQEVDHRKRMMEEYRKLQEDKSRAEDVRAAAKKPAAKKPTYDEDDEDRLPVWKKGAIVAASIMAVWWVGSTAWGYINEHNRLAKLHTYPVTGKIFLEGTKPLTKGAVTFIPTGPEPNRECSGFLAKDGTFQLSAYVPNDGAPAGEYVVTIIPEATKLEGGWVTPQERRIPQKFRTVRTSPLKVEVKSGDNAFEFKLDS